MCCHFGLSFALSLQPTSKHITPSLLPVGRLSCICLPLVGWRYSCSYISDALQYFVYFHLYLLVKYLVLALTMALPRARSLPASAQAICTQKGFVPEVLMMQRVEFEYIMSPIADWLGIDAQVMAD